MRKVALLSGLLIVGFLTCALAGEKATKHSITIKDMKFDPDTLQIWSNIAAHLAKGRSLGEAVEAAKAFVTEAIRQALAIGHGVGPVDQLWSIDA